MKGRPLVLDWHETADELRHAYRQEPLAEVRLRLHALWLLRRGQSARAVAQVVGVHESTVSQWVTWYRRGGGEVWPRSGSTGRVAAKGAPPN